jgi:hypothetical protein
MKLHNGDLIVGAGRSFETVTGKDKLFQDLKLRILERIGIDPATPTYGSRLDGGVIDGRVIPSLIGGVASADTVLEVKAEIYSILSQYQEQQLEKIRDESNRFQGKHTLSRDEILHTVDSVEVAIRGEIIFVRVTCTTLSGTNFQLDVPLRTS